MNAKYQNDSLGTRMKAYESVAQSDLMKRTPVIIRIDGRAFHTYTKVFKRETEQTDTPYSPEMHEAMMYTTNRLVENIQGCQVGYTQSDEISLLVRDWDTIETQAWFGNSLQKIVSVSASIATAAFNQFMGNRRGYNLFGQMAQFDARAHNIPKEEVNNYFIWRQQDASRNSVQMFGRHFFSQKEMQGKNNSQVQDMLMLQKGINWNDVPTWMKRGSCVLRNTTVQNFLAAVVEDDDIPIFTQDRKYIEQYLEIAE